MSFEPQNEYNIQPDTEELNRKPAETPWYTSYCKLNDDEYYQVVYNHQGVIARFDWMPVKISETRVATNRAANAAHVVKCVNNFDKMKEALTKAQDKLAYLYGYNMGKNAVSDVPDMLNDIEQLLKSLK